MCPRSFKRPCSNSREAHKQEEEEEGYQIHTHLKLTVQIMKWPKSSREVNASELLEHIN